MMDCDKNTMKNDEINYRSGENINATCENISSYKEIIAPRSEINSRCSENVAAICENNPGSDEMKAAMSENK